MAAVAGQRLQGEDPKQLAPAEREALARWDFTHEVAILVEAVTGATRMKAAGDDSSLLYILHVDGVLSHARALADFLVGHGSQSDDLFALHYVDDWKAPDPLSRVLRDAINKQLPHLSTSRLQLQWFELEQIAGDVLRSLLLFFEVLSPDARAWFSKAEGNARNALDALPVATTRPRVGPMPARARHHA